MSDGTLDDLIRSGGGVNALAASLGITPAAISQWRRKGMVPAERVLDVSAATGVAPSRIRPDIYPTDLNVNDAPPFPQPPPHPPVTP